MYGNAIVIIPKNKLLRATEIKPANHKIRQKIMLAGCSAASVLRAIFRKIVQNVRSNSNLIWVALRLSSIKFTEWFPTEVLLIDKFAMFRHITILKII
jgi:hypothetical protein